GEMLDIELLGPSHLRQNKQFFPQVHDLLKNFSWFKLEPVTESIIIGFDGLRSKLNDRIAAKKDLFQVSACLTPLSVYLYTQIPDIPDTEEDRSYFAERETIALNTFAEEISQLSPYTSEHHVAPGTQQTAAKKAQLRSVISSTVGNPSTFIRFFWTWCVIQFFLGIAVPI